MISADPSTHGAMFVPIILGSDKTMVSVATRQNKYYPLYLSIGNVQNHMRCAHKNMLVVIGFLPIPKGESSSYFHSTWANVHTRCQEGYRYRGISLLQANTDSRSNREHPPLNQTIHHDPGCHDLILGKPSSTFFAKIFVTSKPINMFRFDELIINTTTRLVLHQTRTNTHPWTDM